MTMGANTSKGGKVENAKSSSGNDVFYKSVEEWEADNFPNLMKQRAREEIRKNPEALGTAIADDVFRRLGLNFLNCP